MSESTEMGDMHRCDERQAQRLQRTQVALDQLENHLVVDGDAVMDWLVSWGKDNETRLPGS